MGIAASQISKLLSSLRTNSGANENRRTARRVTVVTRGVVRVIDGGREQRFSVLTRDISTSGLGLIAAAPIQRGLAIAIDVSDGNEQVITMNGVVRYCRSMADGLWGVGVEFDESEEASIPSKSSKSPRIASLSGHG